MFRLTFHKSYGLVVVLAGVLVFLGIGHARAVKIKRTGLAKPSPIDRAILNTLPGNWKLVERVPNQVPLGHHLNDSYDGPRGELLILSGPKDVSIHWRDPEGRCYEAPVAKESLEVWIMPARYRDSWTHVFNLRNDHRARLVYAGSMGRVYAEPSHHLKSVSEFKTLVDSLRHQSADTDWPDTPRNNPQVSLSWTHWNNDLRSVLEKRFAPKP